MDKTAKFLLIVALVSGVLVLGATGFYLDWSGKQRTRTYFELIENQTSAFSDRISLYLARERTDLLTSTVDAMSFTNDVIYVQVVQRATVVSDERKVAGNGLALDVLTPTASIQTRLDHLPDGSTYLDVIKTLFPLPTQGQTDLKGYVRIGRTLGELEAQINNERLVTLWLAAGAFLVLLGGAWASSHWRLHLHRKDRLQQKEVTPVSSPVAALPPDAPPVSPATPPATALRQVGALALDDARKYVEVRGRPVELSPKEFDLLKLLCQEPGKVYANDEILKSIWPEHSFASAQDVKQYIYFLRRKLEENPKKPSIIVTVRGFGYKVEAGLQSNQTPPA